MQNTIGSISCLVLLFAAPAREEARVRDVRSAFASMCEAAAEPDGERFRAMLVEDALRSLRDDETRELVIRDLAEKLRTAEVVDVREHDGLAIVRFRSTPEGEDDSEEREVTLIQESGDPWLIAAPYAYAVSGASLARRQGKRPAVIRLMERTTNGPYGASGYSFAHVTGDESQCKNRMDLWFCHNEDLHIDAGSRVVDLGKKKLSSVKEVPLDVDWSTREVRARKGSTYVLHCTSGGRTNYYVKFRIKALKRGVAEIEWTLLTDGHGAPPDIHTANPNRTGDGADGTDGLCTKD